MSFAISFVKLFLYGLSLAYPLMLLLVAIIISLGFITGRREGWSIFDSIYWSFITATTVGYGDIRPLTKISKAFSVLIALTGMIFTGILVALAVQAAMLSFSENINVSDVKLKIETIK